MAKGMGKETRNVRKCVSEAEEIVDHGFIVCFQVPMWNDSHHLSLLLQGIWNPLLPSNGLCTHVYPPKSLSKSHVHIILLIKLMITLK